MQFLTGTFLTSSSALESILIFWLYLRKHIILMRGRINGRQFSLYIWIDMTRESKTDPDWNVYIKSDIWVLCLRRCITKELTPWQRKTNPLILGKKNMHVLFCSSSILATSQLAAPRCRSMPFTLERDNVTLGPVNKARNEWAGHSL